MIRRILLTLALLVGTAVAVPSAQAVSAQPVWVFGDSISAGTWLNPGESWPSRLDDSMGPGQQVSNYAIGGQAFAFGTNRMDTLIKNTLSATAEADRPSVLLVMAGTNDLIQSQNDMYVTRAAMFSLNSWMNQNAPTVKLYFISIPPLRTDAAYADALSLRRDNLNGWERTQWIPYGQLLDVGDVLTVGSTYADPRFYRDHLHPDADGQVALADGIFTLLTQKGVI